MGLRHGFTKKGEFTQKLKKINPPIFLGRISFSKEINIFAKLSIFFEKVCKRFSYFLKIIA